MNDPIFIEKAFNTLMSALPGLQSKRDKLFAIQDFLQLIHKNKNLYSGYLDQLLPQVPKFENVYEISGLDPQRLNDVHEILLDMYGEGSLAEELLNGLKNLVTKSYEWVGIRESNNRNDSISIFDSQLPVQQNIHTVLVPVVETMGHHKSGRLRNLVIKSIGNTPANHHELTKIFTVYSNQTDQTKNGYVQSATNLLINELELNSRQRWQSTASFEYNDASHSGNSADLAMSGLFFCSIIEAMDLKEQFRLNPAIAITGEISEEGIVKEVSNETLQQKVEATFFSWTQILVVPEKQVGAVYAIIDQLKEKYPKRDLIIIGVQHLRDLFYDRRLTLHSKKSTLEHTGNRLWRKRFSALAIVGYIIMTIIIAALVIGPIDRNPVSVEYTNNEAILYNKTGRIVGEITLDDVNTRYATNKRPSVPHNIVTLFDLDGDGLNEVLLNRISVNNVRNPELMLLSSDLSDTLWTNPLNLKVDYLEHPYAIIDDYSARVIQVEDIDSDSNLEIVLTLEQETYFQGHIWILDAATGSREQTYMGTGWFSQYIIHDFDSDNSSDLLVCGHFKGFDLYGCSLLDGQNISGFTPLSDRYIDEFKPVGPAKLIFAWKGSVLKESVEKSEFEFLALPGIFASSLYPSRENVIVTFNEASIDWTEPVISTPLLYNFDFRFNPLAIGSSDEYDQAASILFEQGILPFMPDAHYLHSLRDSLYYWNGTNWIQEPTLNPDYLELVGEDSTYYKDWYFKKD